MCLAQEEHEVSAEVTLYVGRNGAKSKFKLWFSFPFAGIWKHFHKSFSQAGHSPILLQALWVLHVQPCSGLPALAGRRNGVRAV